MFLKLTTSVNYHYELPFKSIPISLFRILISKNFIFGWRLSKIVFRFFVEWNGIKILKIYWDRKWINRLQMNTCQKSDTKNQNLNHLSSSITQISHVLNFVLKLRLVFKLLSSTMIHGLWVIVWWRAYQKASLWKLI